MEDHVISRLCVEVAHLFFPAAKHLGASSTASAQPFLQTLAFGADTIARHAITLYRLCYAKRPTILLSESGDSTMDAAFCVCAAIVRLYPAVWRQLVSRAAILHPRSPLLRLGSVHPASLSIKEVERFVQRSHHLLPLDNAKHDSNESLERGVSVGVTGGVVLRPEEVERVAAIYFFAVTSVDERKRHPTLIQVKREGTDAATGRDGNLLSAGSVSKHRSGHGAQKSAADCVEGSAHLPTTDLVRCGPNQESHVHEGGQHPSAADDVLLHLLNGAAISEVHNDLIECDEDGIDTLGVPYDILKQCRGSASLPSSSMFSSIHVASLEEVSHQAEVTARKLYWKRMEACTRCPLMFSLKPFVSHRRMRQRGVGGTSHGSRTYGGRCCSPQDLLGDISFPGRQYSHRRAGECVTSWYASPAHLLSPTHLDHHSLQLSPPFVLTSTFLWTRLLICAVWVAVYADVTVPTLAMRADKSSLKRPRSSCGDPTRGPLESTSESLKGVCGAPTTAEAIVGGGMSEMSKSCLFFCIRVIKAAQKYSKACCPVCDGLHRDRPRVRWSALHHRQDGAVKNLRGSLSAYENEKHTTEDESEVQFCARLFQGWTAFACAGTLNDAVRELMRGGARDANDDTDKVPPAGETSYLEGNQPQAQQEPLIDAEVQEVFFQALARRVDAVASELSKGPSIFPNSSTPTVIDSGVRTRTPLPENHSATSLEKCSWVNGRWSLAQIRCMTLHQLVKEIVLGECSVERCAEGMGISVSGWECPSATLISTPATSQRPSQGVSSLIAPLVADDVSPTNGPHSHARVNARKPGNSGDQARLIRYSHTQYSPNMTPQSQGSIPAYPMSSHQRFRLRRRRLFAQQRSMYQLLDFTPSVPVVREEDTIMECAECYSWFHRGCVCPVQRDLPNKTFLCHTCRLNEDVPGMPTQGKPLATEVNTDTEVM